MFDDIHYLIDPCLRDPPRFQPLDRFHKGGAPRVFYKGDAPKQKETPQEAALASVAQQKWNQYQTHGRKAEDKYIGDVGDMNSTAARKQVTGSAQRATSAEYGQARRGLGSNLTSAGINPNSGKFKSAMGNFSDAQGASATDTASRTASQQRDEYVRGLNNIAAIGSGQATTAQHGLSDVATAAAQKAASDARTDWNDSRALQSAVGTAAGIGLSAYKPQSQSPFSEEQFQAAHNLQYNQMNA